MDVKAIGVSRVGGGLGVETVSRGFGDNVKKQSKNKTWPANSYSSALEQYEGFRSAGMFVIETCCSSDSERRRVVFQIMMY